MKKSILLGLSPALLLLIATGCQKDSIRKSTANESCSDTKQQDLRVWWDTGRRPGIDGQDFGCEGIGGNCLPDATVSPKEVSLLTDFGQSSNPEIFAENNYSKLSGVLRTALLDDVINGKLSVTIRGKIGAEKRGYLLFSSGDGTIQSVHPFKQ